MLYHQPLVAVVVLLLFTNEDKYYCIIRCRLQAFHELYCHFFIRFNEAWRKADPPNMMSFTEIHDSFLITIIAAVQSNELEESKK